MLRRRQFAALGRNHFFTRRQCLAARFESLRWKLLVRLVTVLWKSIQNLSFSSQALHFVMQAVFRFNLLLQRWPNARCFTGEGVSFAVLEANTCLWYSYF